MAAHADLFAVRDAAFEPAGTIAGANKFFRLIVVTDLVVDLGAGQGTGFGAGANRHRLDRGNRHHCLRQTPVEFQVPSGVRAEAGHHSARCDFKDTAERVAFTFLLLDQLNHTLLCLFLTATQRRVGRNGRDLIEGKLQRRIRNSTKLNHVTKNLDSEMSQQLPGESAARNPRRRLAR